MGNACQKGAPPTPEDQENKKRSLEIDQKLMDERKKQKDQVKLLLLGPGESGKSTIFKQMKIISDSGGFSKDELKDFTQIVFGNIITQMKVLVHAAKRLNIEMEIEANKERLDRIIDLPAGGDSWSPQTASDIKHLWADRGIRETYELRDTKYQLNDSAAYFFEHIDRIMLDSYVPSESDVLRARVRTTGLREADFKFGDLKFKMVDVGGQRSERRKWIHCFDCVTAVIFCVALSEYDQTLREDLSTNRMKESLLLFDEICNSPWFTNTAFILFLNKTDLFKEKIQKKDLTVCFPNYTGGCNYEEAVNFIQRRFLEQNTSPHAIYTHFTCAISTDNVAFVFKAVRETILKNILNEIF